MHHFIFQTSIVKQLEHGLLIGRLLSFMIINAFLKTNHHLSVRENVDKGRASLTIS